MTFPEPAPLAKPKPLPAPETLADLEFMNRLVFSGPVADSLNQAGVALLSASGLTREQFDQRFRIEYQWSDTTVKVVAVPREGAES